MKPKVVVSIILFGIAAIALFWAFPDIKLKLARQQCTEVYIDTQDGWIKYVEFRWGELIHSRTEAPLDNSEHLMSKNLKSEWKLAARTSWAGVLDKETDALRWVDCVQHLRTHYLLDPRVAMDKLARALPSLRKSDFSACSSEVRQ